MSYYYDICTQESCEHDSKFSRVLRLKNLSSIGLILSPLLRLASVQNERKSVSKRKNGSTRYSSPAVGKQINVSYFCFDNLKLTTTQLTKCCIKPCILKQTKRFVSESYFVRQKLPKEVADGRYSGKLRLLNSRSSRCFTKRRKNWGLRVRDWKDYSNLF